MICQICKNNTLTEDKEVLRQVCNDCNSKIKALLKPQGPPVKQKTDMYNIPKRKKNGKHGK